jgi:ABC-type Mn2+/Zn2+ transport system permease subunit
MYGDLTTSFEEARWKLKRGCYKMFLSLSPISSNSIYMLRAFDCRYNARGVGSHLGTFVVVRRLSSLRYLGSLLTCRYLGHLFLSSIGIVTFFERPLYLGIIFSIIGGLLIEMFRRSYNNFQEISMVIVISLGAALSAIFFSLSKKTGSLYNYLFGSILTVTNYYIVLILITALIVAILFILFGKQSGRSVFDESSAKFLGINVNQFQIDLSLCFQSLFPYFGISGVL